MNMTMKRLADMAGVSQCTVSMILNDKAGKRVKPETVALIKELARKHDYRPNMIARSMHQGYDNVIAFVSCGGNSEFQTRIGTELYHELSKENFAVKLYLLSDNHRQIIRQLLEQKVAGVIFLAPRYEDFAAIDEAMRKKDIPCAFVNLSSDLADRPSFTSDDRQGSYEAVKYLIELGHRRISCITYGTKAEFIQNRTDGYCQAMADLLPGQAISFLQLESSYVPINREAIKSMLFPPAPAQRPTAVFCPSDVTAMEIMMECYRCNIRIPDELSIVGFANYAASELTMVPLTTVEQPFEEMAKQVVKSILQLIHRKECDCSHKKLPTRLVIRHSAIRCLS